MSSAPDRGHVVRGRRWVSLPAETVAAGILASLIAVPSPLSVSLSTGGAISLALAPLTFPEIWRNVRARWLFLVMLALVPAGWLVAQASLLEDNGRTFSTRVFLYQAAMPVGLIASICGAYWCIGKLGMERFLLLSFTGLLAASFFTYNYDNPWKYGFATYNHENPWKYGFALPLSVLAILLLARNRRMLLLVVTPLLVAVSIAADYRSWIAILGIIAILTILVGSRSEMPSAARVATLGFGTIAAGAVVATLVVQASTSGLLGDYLEQRTKQQLEITNGNLLLGGRPEWGAAIALWREDPLGIGIGVTPSSDDFWLAIRSMPFASRGLQEVSIVAESFRDGQVSFHSTLWTFWGVYGVAGIVFAVLALIYLAHATMMAVTRSRRPNVRAAAALLMLSAGWDILFSPTVVAALALALALALHISSQSNVVPNETKELEDERSSAD